MPSSMVGLQTTVKNVADTSDLDAFAKNANVKILVGYLSGVQHYSKGQKNKDGESRNSYAQKDLADLAAILSFGDANIPARPFIKEGLLSKKDELRTKIKAQLDKIKDGNKADWKKVGTDAVGAVQEFVKGDYYKENVPNAKSTIAQKGSDKPLIDTANLVNSLEFIVEV